MVEDFDLLKDQETDIKKTFLVISEAFASEFLGNIEEMFPHY